MSLEEAYLAQKSASSVARSLFGCEDARKARQPSRRADAMYPREHEECYAKSTKTASCTSVRSSPRLARFLRPRRLDDQSAFFPVLQHTDKKKQEKCQNDQKYWKTSRSSTSPRDSLSENAFQKEEDILKIQRYTQELEKEKEKKMLRE